jgi:hypothetical protein
MATDTAGTVARDYGVQMIHYLRRNLTFNDKNTDSFVLGTLPAGALVLKALSGAYVVTAFNGTTPTIDVGPTSDSGHDLWASAISLGTQGYITFDEAASAYARVDADTEVTIDLNATDDTAGDVEVVLAYICDNDN